LPGEGAELHSKENGDLVRVGADVVGSAGEAGGSGNAAESQDRIAADVTREMHAVDEARVDGGARNAGDADEEDGIELIGAEAGEFESAIDGALAEVDGG